MDSLFFALSKIFWAFARPDHLLLLLLTLSVLLLWPAMRAASLAAVPHRRRAIGRIRLGWHMLRAVWVMLWLVAVTPASDWLLMPLETRFPQYVAPSSTLPTAGSPVAGIIVLGGAEQLQRSQRWQSLSLNGEGERIVALQTLLRRYPDAQVLFSSGSGKLDQGLRGADLIGRLLQQSGEQDRVILEREARNTHENALFSQKRVDLTRPGQWLLVTSAFHMPRAMGVFTHIGWQVTPYPVGYRTLPDKPFALGMDLYGGLENLSMGVHEWIGLLAYWLTDRTSQLFPGPRS